MARQLHVLDRARAGAGGVRGHAEARKGPLVGALDPLRRGGGGVPDRVARALRRAVPRPLLDLQLAARAPARHRRVAHDEVLLRAEWADLRRPRLAVVALRATRHGARPGGARWRPAGRAAPAGWPDCARGGGPQRAVTGAGQTAR